MRLVNVQHTHPTPRKYLELIQDVIVFGLCAMLFVAMGTKLFHLGQLMLRGTDFALVVGDILFILMLLELFRLLLLYLEEYRVMEATMVEVGIVSTLREVIVRGALHIEWLQLLVVCTSIMALCIVLRYAGIRSHPPDSGEAQTNKLAIAYQRSRVSSGVGSLTTSASNTLDGL